jgi:tetratricopeptide (TPR) repeat protein
MTRGVSQLGRRWRRAVGCAVVAGAAMAGCQDAPVEGPVDAAARPLQLAGEAADCVACDHTEAALALIPLPAIEGPAAPSIPAGPSLLPPRPLPLDAFTELPHMDEAAAPAADTPSPLASNDADNPQLAAALAEAHALLADASPTATGSPTGAIVTERAQAKIRRGYALAHRGANYAARNEFLAVLHMIAEAKDQKHGARRRTIALANGLRALEEAEDFAPRGAEFDVNVKLAVIVSSHQTTIAKTPAAADLQQAAGELMPRQLADLYFRYAQFQLAGAVAGEPAGSMALHALGKLYSQLARTEPEANPQADRRAFTLQQAALLARDDNHLAAHELGVLLAETGHFVEAEHLLHQVAAREPHPVVFRNLARVQRKLGHEQFALANERHAQAIATGAPPNNNGIIWVPPAALAQTGDGAPSAAPTPHIAAKPAIRKPQSANGHASMQPSPVHNVSRLPGGLMR